LQRAVVEEIGAVSERQNRSCDGTNVGCHVEGCGGVLSRLNREKRKATLSISSSMLEA